MSPGAITATVCAACPPEQDSEVTEVCRQQKVMKAFGRYSSAEGSVKWVQQWEAQVVQAVTGLVAERDATRARILCIEGGSDCGEQMAAQQNIVSMIRKELGDAAFPIRTEWIPVDDFWAEFGRGGAPERVPEQVVGHGGQNSETPAVQKCGTQETSGARERTPSVLRLRKASLTTIWVCDECQAYFDTKQTLVEHQQAESHWGPATIEDNGRTYIRDTDLAALEAGDAVIEDTSPGSKGDKAAAPIAISADANDDGCVVYDLSPRTQRKTWSQKPQHPNASEAPASEFAPAPRVAPAPQASAAPLASAQAAKSGQKSPMRMRKQASRTTLPEGDSSNKSATAAGNQAATGPQAQATGARRPAVSFDAPEPSSPAGQRGRNQDGASQMRSRSTGDQLPGTRSQNLSASMSTPLLFYPELDPNSWPALGASVNQGLRQRSLSAPRNKRRP